MSSICFTPVESAAVFDDLLEADSYPPCRAYGAFTPTILQVSKCTIWYVIVKPLTVR